VDGNSDTATLMHQACWQHQRTMHPERTGLFPMLPSHVSEAFDLRGPVQSLPGGSVDVYRAGNLVLKRIHQTSLENQHSLELLPWLGEQLEHVTQDGFRLSRPVRSRYGTWLLPDGWTAWTYVDGEPLTATDVPSAIEAVRHLHRALQPIAPHPLLEQNETAWGFAHRHCLGGRPAYVHPVLEDLVDRLYACRAPLPALPCQLIHGDLNAANVLVAPGLPPAFIDLTPFWAPVDFALGMFGNWVGPRLGDAAVLRFFADIPHFPQWLIRAALRMLLIVSHLQGVDDWEQAPEKRAAEMALTYVGG
jgi:hypothetical protein